MTIYNQDKKYVRNTKLSKLTVEERLAIHKLHSKINMAKRYKKHYKVKAKRKPYEHSQQ
jgi:fructosamine-3-kinase